MRIITTAAAALLVASPALADLEGQYQQQLQKEARVNDCAHWHAAQWSSDGGIGLKRIRQFPNGDLMGSELVLADSPTGFKCRGDEFVGWGRSRMGYSKKIFKDGSGTESTKKIEGNELVEYTSGCGNWKCPRIHVIRSVLGTRITPEQRAEEHQRVRSCAQKSHPRRSLLCLNDPVLEPEPLRPDTDFGPLRSCTGPKLLCGMP